jgi:hypothetical protein
VVTVAFDDLQSKTSRPASGSQVILYPDLHNPEAIFSTSFEAPADAHAP